MERHPLEDTSFLRRLPAALRDVPQRVLLYARSRLHRERCDRVEVHYSRPNYTPSAGRFDAGHTPTVGPEFGQYVVSVSRADVGLPPIETYRQDIPVDPVPLSSRFSSTRLQTHSEDRQERRTHMERHSLEAAREFDRLFSPAVAVDEYNSYRLLDSLLRGRRRTDGETAEEVVDDPVPLDQQEDFQKFIAYNLDRMVGAVSMALEQTPQVVECNMYIAKTERMDIGSADTLYLSSDDMVKLRERDRTGILLFIKTQLRRYYESATTRS